MPYGSILAAHEDCVAPGMALRDVRPPWTELSPIPEEAKPEPLPLPERFVGGPSVRTELTVSRAKPGGKLTGTVEVTGGDHQVSIGYIALVLVTDVGVQGGLLGDQSTGEISRQ